MNQETRYQLNPLVMEGVQNAEKTKERKEQSKFEKDSFLEEFEGLRKDVIRPVMEDIGNHLQSHGHDYCIYEQEELEYPGSFLRHAGITIKIFPVSVRYASYSDYVFGNTPSVSFFADSSAMMIWVYCCNKVPGENGNSGIIIKRYKSNQIGKNLVKEEVTGVLKEIIDYRNIYSELRKMYAH